QYDADRTTAWQRAGRPRIWPTNRVGVPNAPILRANSARTFDSRHNSDRPVFWPVGQHLTRHSRNLGLFLALAVAIAAAVALVLRRPASSPQTTPGAASTPAGGALVVSVRTEPVSFNRHRSRDSSTDLVSTLTQAKLVRIN